MEVRTSFTIQEKLAILSDAAKYDVSCSSSGSDRAAEKGRLGSASAAGICHSFAADGRCISLLKILLTNECVFDCKYCVNRRSNDVVRTAFTPEEVCELTMGFYRRNYIEGLFLSSGVMKSPDHTMKLLYEVLYLLRKKYGFLGYIHVKGIPGADPVLIEKIGFLADRMSLNLELPTTEGLRLLAPSKKEESILKPIRHIQGGIHGNDSASRGAYSVTRSKIGLTEDVNLLWNAAVPKDQLIVSGPKKNSLAAPAGTDPSNLTCCCDSSDTPFSEKTIWLPEAIHREDRNWLSNGRLSTFVPAGQSTQMIIGATRETDFDIMMKAESMYRNFDLKRVYYSAFINTTHDSALPETPDGPPLLREHRLYQTDFLMRYYGFRANEILTPEAPDLPLFYDPKCTWALRHLELFPVEVSCADYGTLLRVPGIGPKSAERIVKARRTGSLSFEALKKMGVVLKRAHYFILCHGRQLFPTRINERFISEELISMDREKNWRLARGNNARQTSLFDDFDIPSSPSIVRSVSEIPEPVGADRGKAV